MLGQTWTNYFGYYRINANGTSNRSEVSITTLEDGYYRVSIDLSNAINYNSEPVPTEYISLFYVRGIWSTASGYIDFNIDL